MKTIQLGSTGLAATVDDEDYVYLGGIKRRLCSREGLPRGEANILRTASDRRLRVS